MPLYAILVVKVASFSELEDSIHTVWVVTI